MPDGPQPSAHEQLEAGLAAFGLQLRGAWRPEVKTWASGTDLSINLPDGQPAVMIYLVGVVGSAFWPAFKASTFYRDGLPDPLDRWSHAIGTELAARWGALAVFPFEGPPYHPFQQWAARAEQLKTSPVMLKIHPTFGLWHAYRFALAFSSELPVEATVNPSPTMNEADICLSCDGQPCLQACPVQAFTGAAFRLEACADHLHGSPDGDCMRVGCLARRACPVGTEYAYTPDHAAFHMRAFIRQH